MHRHEVFDDVHYVGWRKSRLDKIQTIFGKDWFKGKSILELACGQGHIGSYIETLGANVTYAEGRKSHCEMMTKLHPKREVININQEEPWSLDRQFDMIIHWGVLYHLDNWKQDLACTLKHSGMVLLESEVLDSNDSIEIKIEEPFDGWDQAISTVGSRPSASLVEQVLSSLGATYTRYDHADLNSGFHQYDWKVENTGESRNGIRRFWIVEK